MSEFSSSYHVRSDDPNGTIATLVEKGWAGIWFGPNGSGWISFVPYAALPAMREIDPFSGVAEQLAGALQRPVLHCFHAEDHGWGFTYLAAGRLLCRFGRV